jgi:hypothetical protein
MANRKIEHLKGKRINYRLTHPLVGANLHFDSWMVLCEHVMDIAEIEAKKRLTLQLPDLIGSISDEIIATAEEFEHACGE